MAFALTIDPGNPIRVTGTTDTSGIVYKPNGPVIHIKRIYWFNPTTAGDLCTLKDEFGKYIIEMRAEANAGSQWHEIDVSYRNIYCDNMDSGTLYIYQ